MAECFSVHMGHQSEIDVDDADHARGVWLLDDLVTFPANAVNPYAGATIRGHGHYVETYVRLDGAWRFQTIDLHRLRIEVQTVGATAYPPVPA